MKRPVLVLIAAAALALPGCSLDVAPPASAPETATQPEPDAITAAHDGFGREVCTAIEAGNDALAANLVLLHGEGHQGGPDEALKEAQLKCPDNAAALNSAVNGSQELENDAA